MNKFILVVILYLLALFQLGFWSYFPINQAWPNLVLLFSLSVVVLSKRRSSVWLAALWGGLLMDLFFYHQAGWALLGMVILTALIQGLKRFFAIERWMMVLPLLALAVLAYEPMLYFILFVWGRLGGQVLSAISLAWLPLIMQWLYGMILVVLAWLLMPPKFRERLPL